MQVITSIVDLKSLIHQYRQQGKRIGLVPTMGYLHTGHLTLMGQARKEQDVVVASIFVNPIQFGPKEDYAAYPRDIARDSKLAADAGVDILFVPSVEEMYPQGINNMTTYVDVLKVTEGLCGASRPGHFRGVATVVNKLFNLVEPHTAYFGQKDAQQVVVIRSMVRDLNMNVKIVSVPIVREADGLALSSRNVFLSPDERKAALVLSRALKTAHELLDGGEQQADKLLAAMQQLIQAEPLAAIDYVSISDAQSLTELATVDRPALVALAVKIGKTRLIDNFIWGD